jgi:transposase InsO family protein
VRRAKNEFEQKLTKVRSDNGTEFKNTNVEEFCDEKGISQLHIHRGKMVWLKGKIGR